MSLTVTRLRRRLWQAATVVILVAAVGALRGPYMAIFGNLAGSPAQPARAAPCLPGQPVDIAYSPHIAAGEAASVRYNSTPATSGPHFAFTVAPGVYDAPVPEGLTVHALEHGHVVIRYASSTPPEDVARLVTIAKRFSADVVLAPYSGLDRGIALTAWGRIDLLERYDEQRITDFVRQLRGRYDHGWTRRYDCDRA